MINEAEINTATDEYQQYYIQNLEESREFQDYVYYQLYRKGIVVIPLESRKYQKLGENLAGIEVKLDKERYTTGNLYIEYAEKSHPDNKEYAPSGILREDNTWLWIIGDYRVQYLLTKNILKKFYSDRKFKLKHVEKKTSKGYLLPETIAKDWAALIMSNENEIALSLVL